MRFPGNENVVHAGLIVIVMLSLLMTPVASAAPRNQPNDVLAGAIQETEAPASAPDIGMASLVISDQWAPNLDMLGADDAVFLWHQTVADAYLILGKSPFDESMTGSEYLETTIGDGGASFLDKEMTEITLLASGTVQDATDWTLFEMLFDEDRFGVLGAITIFPEEGQAVVVGMAAPVDQFEVVLQDAVEGIQYVETGAPLAGFEPSDIADHLQSNAADSSPDASVEPTETGRDLPLTLPTLPAGEDQGFSTVPVGFSTIGYGETWQYDTERSTYQIAAFNHSAEQHVAFLYGEVLDPSVQDTEGAMDVLANVFLEDFAATDTGVVDSGTNEQDLRWRMYTLTIGSVPASMVLTAEVDSAEGMTRFSMLMAPEEAFTQAIADVSAGIEINGNAPQIASLSTKDSAPAVEPSATYVPTPTSGGLLPPPLTPATETAQSDATSDERAGSSPPADAMVIDVANVQVAATGQWVYSEADSTPGQYALFYGGALQQSSFAMGVFENSAGIDPEFGSEEFINGFIEGAGATSDEQITTQTLSSGNAWTMYIVTAEGEDLIVVAYADVMSDPTEFRAQILVADTDMLPIMLASAKTEVWVDGEPAFSPLAIHEVVEFLES